MKKPARGRPRELPILVAMAWESRRSVQESQKILLVKSVAIVVQGKRRISDGGAVGGGKCLVEMFSTAGTGPRALSDRQGLDQQLDHQAPSICAGEAEAMQEVCV